jgi:cation transport protein ChaC
MMTMDEYLHSCTIDRDSLEKHALASMVAAAGHGDLVLSPEALDASLAAVRPAPGAPVWIFAYGSLLWNPVFHPVATMPGALRGYHRRFCFWTIAGRGSCDNPGLMLALERGGTCRGLVLRVDDAIAEQELRLLWRREMVTGAYVPKRVKIGTPDGTVEAITFLANPRHRHYCGGLPEAQAIRHLATAAGALGPNRDYLERLWSALHALRIPDRGIDRLHAAVRNACR